MKAVSLLFLATLSLNALASQEIWEALAVKSRQTSLTDSQATHFKGVGGLACVLTVYRRGTDTYGCELDLQAADPAAIYEALTVEENPLSAPRSDLRFEKVVGALACEKVTSLRPGVDPVTKCKVKL